VPKDYRSICGGRLEPMKGELWAPGKPSFTKPYCASGALLHWTLSSLATRGTAMKEQSNQRNPKNMNEEQLFLETRNRNIRSSRKPSTPKVEEGYCNRTTQSGPLTRGHSHQAQNTVEHTDVKQGRAWTKEEIREVIWCYMYGRQHFTKNYKKVYEIWRQRNPECRMYMDAKKLMNQRNYIMKHKKIMEMEVEEIRRELQEIQRSHLEEREEGEEEELQHSGTRRDGEQKPDTASAFRIQEELNFM